MLTKVRHSLSFAVIALIIALTGCGAKESDTSGQPSGEPITLKVYQHISSISDTEFKQFIADPVHKKFPNITMELVRSKRTDTPEPLLSADEFPDLIFTGSNFYYKFLVYGLPVDLNPYIKKYHFDLSRIEPEVVDAIKVYGDKGQMYALPFSVNFSVLFYNKDIFDKFALPYPKDGMTWSQAVELSGKVTREDGGKQYYGLDADNARKLGSQLSLPIVDAKTYKATINTDGWQKVYSLMYDIAKSDGGLKVPSPTEAFTEKQSLAMYGQYGDVIGKMEENLDKGIQFNWDMVTYPSFPEAPGFGLRSVAHSLMISSVSKHKDEAFQALMYILSDENQLEMTKVNRLSPLRDPKIKQAYGTDLKSLKGKNIQAIFKTNAAKNPPPTPYDEIAESTVNQGVNDVLTGKIDVNTALRLADEKLNSAIAAEMDKK